MNPHFNLIDEAWIPVVTMEGTPERVGLRAALAEAHRWREVSAASPLVVAALHRLLLAVVHRVADGPRTTADWQVLWSAGRFDAAAVDAYLERWRNRFDLFDPARPFYQCAASDVGARTVNFCTPELASGNNAMLFDHHGDDRPCAVSFDVAALLLLVQQTFGLAGLSGLPDKFTDGPWARGVVFLLQGRTLFETLALNAAAAPSVERWLGEATQGDDAPAWERDDPFQPVRGVPLGYLDYLTWPARRVRLAPDHEAAIVNRVMVAPGLRLDPSMLERDPMKVYRLDPKRGPLPLRFTEEKALWRDSAALFELSETADAGWRPPGAFVALRRLVGQGGLRRGQVYHFTALGMANDQAKINFWRHERMPLPLAYFDDVELVGRLRDALARGEEIGSAVRWSGRVLAENLLAPTGDRRPDKDDVSRLAEQMALERRYWSVLETPFRRLLPNLPSHGDVALEAWRATLFRAARDAFSQAADGAGATGRALKAAVVAQGALEAGLAKVGPKDA